MTDKSKAAADMSHPVESAPESPDSSATGRAEQTVEPPARASPSLLERLKHHKVLEWTLAYAAAAYTLLHGMEMLSDAQEWPHVIVRTLSLVLVLGVPIVATLAWYHGAKGLRRVSGSELVVITLLGIIAGSLLWAFSSKAKHPTVPPAASASLESTVPAAAPRTAVAVLPFANLTGDGSKAFLGEGMADELINALSRVPGLHVPARTASFAYAGRGSTPQQIAQELKVGSLVEGSVQEAGQRIRITVKLLDANSSLLLWSESYDRKFTDILKLEDELSAVVARALMPSLQVSSASAFVAGTQDTEAYRLFLLGETIGFRSDPGLLPQAIDYLKQAAERDPNFVRAYAILAVTYMDQFVAGGVRTGQVLDDTERAARRALALDPHGAQGIAQTELGIVAAFRGRWLEMGSYDLAAVREGSNDGFVHGAVATHLTFVGRMRDAVREAKAAYDLAPANPIIAAFVAHVYSAAGQESESARYTKVATDLGYPSRELPLAGAHLRSALRKGDYQEAAETYLGVERLNGPETVQAAAAIREIFAAMANPRDQSGALATADRAVNSLRVEHGRFSITQATACMAISASLALLKQNDASYRVTDHCLERATTAELVHFPLLDYLFTPEFADFRRDARFQGLATRIGLIEYWRQFSPPDDCELKNDRLSCRP